MIPLAGTSVYMVIEKTPYRQMYHGIVKAMIINRYSGFKLTDL